MHATAYSALLLAVLSGTAAANSDPIQLDPTAANIRHAGHIYYNIATGEKITTMIDSGDLQSPADATIGREIWIADTGNPCADQGYSSSYFFALDDPEGTTSLSLNAIMVDWGDIPFNTVVDCVQIHWVTDHQDTDTDSDSQPDGVWGLGGTWTYWDNCNGRSPLVECVSMPIIQFKFSSLFGEFPSDPNTLTKWTADIDLAMDFAASLTFEIGDNDSDPQGAAAYNPRSDLNDADSNSVPDIDIDQDNLADWCWSVQFVQPGTIDLDDADGDDDTSTGIDGDPSALATIGIAFGSPTPGHAEIDSMGDWRWIPDSFTGPTEDAFTLGSTQNPDGSGVFIPAGSFDFGGLNCTPGQPGGYTPAAHFQTILYGPSSPCGISCPWDLPSESNPGECNGGDGQLNFIDISNFLSLFADGNLLVDFAGNPDGSSDGQLNFLDVSAFLSGFAAGCP